MDSHPDAEETRTAAPYSGSPVSKTDEGDAADMVAPASAIGRFSVLGLVGSGGMGQVYAAYDPQLDRRVALKLLPHRGDERERDRLVREARALARLSHPNVVAVHDVGEHDDRLFIAMEFVEGQTLRQWSLEHPPAGRERLARALELLRDAGRGLEAAHRAGLVHRDVKPKNILVGDDRRVRVVDFGLARSEEGDSSQGEFAKTVRSLDASSADLEGARVDQTVTITGHAIGTPAYMAPEQFTSGAVDTATDQFGFCVTAWEVLFGTRPFEASHERDLLAAVRKHTVTRPEELEVPPKVEAALRKGLAYRPGARHKSFDRLCRVLDDAIAELGSPNARRSHRRRLVVIGTFALLGTAVVATTLERGPSCDGAPRHFDGVWDEARKASLQSAIVETGVSFAPDVWDRLERNVDGWRDEWIAAHRDTCEAAQIRGEQSAQLMDLRMVCLDGRRQRLAAYLDLLSEPDAGRLANADDGFAALPAIDRCGDVEYVQSRDRLPDDPDARALAERLVASLDRAEAHLDAGEPEKALRITESCRSAARREQLSNIAARSHFVAHRAHYQLRDFAQAHAHAEKAYQLAREVDDIELAAAASRTLALVTGVGLYRFDEARWWLQIARLEAKQQDEPLASARVDAIDARVGLTRGNYDEADALASRALATMAAVKGESQEYALLLIQRAQIRAHTSDMEGAEQDLSHARELLGRTVGPRHPAALDVRTVRASFSRRRGAPGRAIEEYREIVAALEEDFGPDHLVLLEPLSGLASAYRVQGDFEAALTAFERAQKLHRPKTVDAIHRSKLLSQQGELLREMSDPVRSRSAFEDCYQLRVDALGANHPDTARARIQYGVALSLAGHVGEAQQEIDAGLAALGDEIYAQHSDNLLVLHGLGLAARMRGDLAAYLEYSRRMLPVIASVYGPDSRKLGVVHGNTCGALAELGRGEDALPHCEEAEALLTLGENTDDELGNLHNNTGVALQVAGKREQAILRYQAALDLWTAAHGEQSVKASMALSNIAEIRHEQGRPREALRLFERVVAILEQIAGRDHAVLLPALLGSAKAHLAAAQIEQAQKVSDRALQIAERNPHDTRRLAEAREVSALVLWEIPSRRKRALALASQALDVLKTRGPTAKDDVVRVEAWLEARDPGRSRQRTSP